MHGLTIARRLVADGCAVDAPLQGRLEEVIRELPLRRAGGVELRSHVVRDIDVERRQVVVELLEARRANDDAGDARAIRDPVQRESMGVGVRRSLHRFMNKLSRNCARKHAVQLLTGMLR